MSIVDDIYELHELELLVVDENRKKLNEEFQFKTMPKEQYYACLQLKYDELERELDAVKEELKEARKQRIRDAETIRELEFLLKEERTRSKEENEIQE